MRTLTILRLGVVAAVSVIISACASVPESSRTQAVERSLNGSWNFVGASGAPQNPQSPDTSTDGWARIEVPSNWFLQGHELSGAAWYKRKFSVDEIRPQQLVRIIFEAVDYAADVWINGHHVGHHQGYFDRFEFNITQFVVSGDENDITVRVDSPLEQAADWSLNKRLIKGVLSHHDTRPGGAWSDRGQAANTGGIWGDVTLAVNDTVAISHVRWHDAIDIDKNTVETTAWINVENQGVSSREYLIRVQESDPLNRHAPVRIDKSVTLKPGKSTVELSLPARTVHLWQTHEHGSPDRYEYQITVSRGAQRLASRSMKRGIRHLDRDPESGEWRVNGKRIFLRGTNYIPSQWLSEMTDEKFRFDLDLMRRANVNAIRVHALVLPERFYRLADEYGMLVWQDFPLQWGYSDDAVFHAEAARQLRVMIRQFGSFASIFAWSMHNEPPWDATWMKYKYPDYDRNQNRALDEMLAGVAVEEDGSRHVHTASLTAEHPWFGWYSGSVADYAKRVDETLITEFGAQALPSMDSLERIFDPAMLWPAKDGDWDIWRYHNFQPRETFKIAKISRGESIHELVRNTQEYQRRLIKFAAESYRRNRYRRVAGIFQFMFVESWPSVNWGVVDYRRKTKPGYDAMRIAYQPVLPTIASVEDHFEAGAVPEFPIWIVNDLHRKFDEVKLHSSLWHGEKMIDSRVDTVAIDADSAAFARTRSAPNLVGGKYSLRLKLVDRSGEVLGTNYQTFTVSPRSVSDSQALDN